MSNEKTTSPNEYADLFAAAFLEWSGGVGYEWKRGDFVQLAALQARFEKSAAPEWLNGPRWSHALKNYFESAIAVPTLADFSVRFATFWKGRLNQYGKLIDVKGAEVRRVEQDFDFCSSLCQKCFLLDAVESRLCWWCPSCEERLVKQIGTDRLDRRRSRRQSG